MRKLIVIQLSLEELEDGSLIKYWRWMGNPSVGMTPVSEQLRKKLSKVLEGEGFKDA